MIRIHYRTLRQGNISLFLFLFLLISSPVSLLHAQESDGTVPPSANELSTSVDETPPVVPGTGYAAVSAPITGTGFPAMETYIPQARSYSSLLSNEGNVLGAVTRAWLDMFEGDQYLRLLPISSRTVMTDAPSTAKVYKGNVSRIVSIRGAGDASIDKAWTSSESIESLVAWYSKRYDVDFSIYRAPIANSPLDTIVVAQAARRINDRVVTIMLWTPTLASNGKAIKSVPTTSTTIFVEERAFRHRSNLVAEGEDAVVELTWNVPYANLIQKASIRYQVDPFLIAALIQQESGFNPNALSVDSAMGLAQMIPTTAEMLGVNDPHNPAQAIDGGTKYLKLMLRRYRGNVEYALAAYNAGPGAVDKYRGVPPYKETKDYVKRIMTRWQEKAGGGYAGKVG